MIYTAANHQRLLMVLAPLLRTLMSSIFMYCLRFTFTMCESGTYFKSKLQLPYSEYMILAVCVYVYGGEAYNCHSNIKFYRLVLHIRDTQLPIYESHTKKQHFFDSVDKRYSSLYLHGGLWVRTARISQASDSKMLLDAVKDIIFF